MAALFLSFHKKYTKAHDEHPCYLRPPPRSGEFSGGWGFSCLVGGKILFDAGEKGDRLLHNIKELGISLNRIEAVVLSHDHWDHWGGLKEVLAQRPGLPVYVPRGISRELEEGILRWGGEPLTGEPGRKLTEGCFLSGTVDGHYKGRVLNEQALVVKGDDGVSVVTGCAHPGVETMVAAALKIFPGHPLNTIMGGFHLYNRSEDEAGQIIERIRSLGFRRVLATHCSGSAAEEAGDLFLHVGWQGRL